MTQYIVSLDVGTSSVRTVLYDVQGRGLPDSETQIKYQARTTPDGGSELDPAMLLDSAAKVVDGALALVPRGDTVVGVAIDTLWHSILGVDARDEAITPLYTWADTRSVPYVDELKGKLDERGAYARTGCIVHPSYPPVRLLWLARTRPDLWTRVARWISFGEYLHLRLFGKAVCSFSMASGTGLLDVHACAWDDEVLRAVGLDAGKLSPLGDRFVDSAESGLRGEWAARWPALSDVPWFPALGDGACGNIGSGCVDRGRIALMVGTSGAMRVVYDKPDTAVVPGLWFYRVDRQRPILGGALSEGGNIFAWLRATMRFGEIPEMEAEIAAIEPDAHGLTILPFLAGERSPDWVASARGTISGLTLATRPADIARAVYEAIAYRFADVGRRLAPLVTADAPIIASGGALLQSPIWMGIMADVLGRPVMALQEHESSSRGAALLALDALGLLPLAEVQTALGSTYEPNLRNHERYQEAIARQTHLYNLLVKPG